MALPLRLPLRSTIPQLSPHLTRSTHLPTRPITSLSSTIRPRSLNLRTTRSPPRLSSSAISIRSASTVYSAKDSTRAQFRKPTTWVLIFVPIVCGFLGVWQVKRLQWKVALIDEVDRNLHRDPMVLPGNINLDVLPEFSFRRVLISGTPLPIPLLLGPSLLDGIPGYSLILPLTRTDGSTILLNRGFIPVARANAIRSGALPPGFVKRANGTIVGEAITEEGLLPRTGDKSYFTPENNTVSNEWFWRDVPGMMDYVKEEAARLGLEEQMGSLQGVMVDVIERSEDPPAYLMQQDIPVGRPAHIELRNQHAQYAVIWFSLTAATTAMLGFVLTKGRRGLSARSDRRMRI